RELESRRLKDGLGPDRHQREVQLAVWSRLVDLVEGRDPVLPVAVRQDIRNGSAGDPWRPAGVAQRKRAPTAERKRHARHLLPPARTGAKQKARRLRSRGL